MIGFAAQGKLGKVDKGVKVVERSPARKDRVATQGDGAREAGRRYAVDADQIKFAGDEVVEDQRHVRLQQGAHLGKGQLVSSAQVGVDTKARAANLRGVDLERVALRDFKQGKRFPAAAAH